jgi:hypothetical protein
MTGRIHRLALAALAIATAIALTGCQQGPDPANPQPSPAQAGPAATTPSKPTTAPPTTAWPATTTGPSKSTTAGAGALPQPIRVLHQGDRLFGVYWVGASLTELSPVTRRLQTLGYPASLGELDCDRGARRWLGVPATITARVAVYFGTEQDARAFAEGVDVRPRPHGHAAAILYCLD